MMKRARRQGQGEMNPIQYPVKHHFVSAERMPYVHCLAYCNIQGFDRSRRCKINVCRCSCKITISSQLRQHRGLRWRNQSCQRSCPVSNLRWWMQQLVQPCIPLVVRCLCEHLLCHASDISVCCVIQRSRKRAKPQQRQQQELQHRSLQQVHHRVPAWDRREVSRDDK